MSEFMSSQALELLQNTAVQAAKTEPIYDSTTDPTRFWMNTAGKLTEIKIPRRFSHDIVGRLGDLVAIAKREAVAGRKPIVWHCLAGVILQCDEDASRAWPDQDRAVMRFKLANAFQRLRTINGASLSQADLVHVLRVDWRGHVIEPDFLAAVRSIKFRRAVSGYSDIQQGKESLGRDVENEVTGAAAIAETIHLQLPVYSNRDLDAEFPVAVDVDVDPQNERFRLSTVGDEMVQIEAAAGAKVRDQLVQMIGAAPVQLYEGCPQQWAADLIDVE